MIQPSKTIKTSSVRLHDDQTMKMEKLAMQLLELKGWTTESEIAGRIYLYFEGQPMFSRRQINLVLNEMMDKYLLKKKRLTHKLKQEYGITCFKGYPLLIVRETIK